MPDTRSHRGAHPEDETLFGAAQLPALRLAASELTWLLDRGYALRSSVALVGDRHSLTQRQRLALSRGVCDDVQLARRRAHEVGIASLRASEVWIDGYNLVITIEAALGGGMIFVGRDSCHRDLASLHGTYRSVTETDPALQLIGNFFARVGVTRCHWLLDRPVSNSGRLRTRMLEVAAASQWNWDVELEFSPDGRLASSPMIVITSDSAILDRSARWFNAAAEIIRTEIPPARLVELFGPQQ